MESTFVGWLVACLLELSNQDEEEHQDGRRDNSDYDNRRSCAIVYVCVPLQCAPAHLSSAARCAC